MYATEKLLKQYGFSTSLEIGTPNIRVLKRSIENSNFDLTNGNDRKAIIEYFSKEVGHFYLSKWDSFVSGSNVSEDLYERINNIIRSVTIVYYSKNHNFDYHFGEDHFYENHPYDCELYDEEDALTFLSPSWELSTIFMTEEQKKKYAEKVVENWVKKVTESTKILDVLYENIPEIFCEKIAG